MIVQRRRWMSQLEGALRSQAGRVHISLTCFLCGRFIFEGLSLLMDQLLIHNARHIRLANKHGMSKMMRNILALQQNLKNIGDGETPLEVEVNFDRSRTYWETFGKGPKVSCARRYLGQSFA